MKMNSMKKIIIFSMFSISLINANIEIAKQGAVFAKNRLSNEGYIFKGVRGDYLKNKEYKIYHTYCYSGNNYAVIGSSDGKITDLDVIVYDKNWKVVVTDSDYQPITTVKFHVKRTGLYHIVTRAYEGEGYFTQVVAFR